MQVKPTMMLGTSHTANKYTYGNVDCSDVGRTDVGINCLFVCLFLLYTGSIFRGKFKYPSVLPYGPVTKYNIKITLPIS